MRHRLHGVDRRLQADAVEGAQLVLPVAEEPSGGSEVLILVEHVHHPVVQLQVDAAPLEVSGELGVLALALLPAGVDHRDRPVEPEGAHSRAHGRREPLRAKEDRRHQRACMRIVWPMSSSTARAVS